MAALQIDTQSIKALQRATRRNPALVRAESKNFLVRGIAAFNRRIIRNPWRMGMSQGGAPHATGNLRDTHLRSVGQWQATIGPDLERAPYARYVHGIEGYPRKRSYQLRPWLDYTVRDSERDIRILEENLLTKIITDLAQ
jgi:hypothetical protein